MKFNIRKMKIMASGPVISWLIDEETMETVTDFILGAPKSMQMVTAAAAAKSHQSCMTLCDPIDSSLPGSSIPGILQARILEWVAISFSSA